MRPEATVFVQMINIINLVVKIAALVNPCSVATGILSCGLVVVVVVVYDIINVMVVVKRAGTH